MNIDNVTKKVYDFYQECQFNEADNENEDSTKIGIHDLVAYQLPKISTNHLDSLSKPKIVEIGCGIGWLSIALAKRYPKAEVVGVDYSDRALIKARRTADNSNVSISFFKKNILLMEDLRFDAVDVVISIGVLHHTSDFKLAILNCAQLLRPGGVLFISLYHKYRRLPFLEYFQSFKSRGLDEGSLRKIYFALDRRSNDPTRTESWFRDQVLHPHETQHTVEEVCNILNGLMRHDFNSISGSKIPNEDSEKLQYALGEASIKQLVYDPGMFYVQLTRI